MAMMYQSVAQQWKGCLQQMKYVGTWKFNGQNSRAVGLPISILIGGPPIEFMYDVPFTWWQVFYDDVEDHKCTITGPLLTYCISKCSSLDRQLMYQLYLHHWRRYKLRQIKLNQYKNIVQMAVLCVHRFEPPFSDNNYATMHYPNLIIKVCRT
jgi:hypothetical protein